MISRRRFSTGLVGGGALATLSGCASSGVSAQGDERLDVVVLGGGLAGLAAARKLTASGLSVRVLEARNRPGGRTYSERSLPDTPDYGGVQIGSSYQRFIGLSGELGVPLYLPNYSSLQSMALHVDGKTMPTTAWPGAVQNRLPAAERALLPSQLERHYLHADNPLTTLDGWDQNSQLDRSIAEVVAEAGASSEAMRLMNITGNHNHNSRISALPAWQRGLMFKGASSSPSKAVAGGTQSLADALAAALPAGTLALNTRAERIAQRNNEVEVQLATGATLRASRVLCTLPIPALRRLDMQMPQAQRRSVASVEYTRITIGLLDCEPFWLDDGLPPMMWTDTPIERVFPRIDPDSGAVVGLKLFINGDATRALDALSDAEFARLAVDTLARIRPASAGKTRFLFRHAWGADPYAGGAYVAWSPGRVAEQRAAVAARVGNVLFAGEHTSDAPGLEGALVSGERAAMRCITELA